MQIDHNAFPPLIRHSSQQPASQMEGETLYEPSTWNALSYEKLTVNNGNGNSWELGPRERHKHKLGARKGDHCTREADRYGGERAAWKEHGIGATRNLHVRIQYFLARYWRVSHESE